MTFTMFINSATTDEEIIEAIQFSDMAEEALLNRDTGFEFHGFDDGVQVLFSPSLDYAMINQTPGGCMYSFYLSEVTSADDAAQAWRDLE